MMPDAMPRAVPDVCPSNAPDDARYATQQTQLTLRIQDPGEDPAVPDAAGPVDKAIVRRVWSFMWGSPGFYWRVQHPSIPQGRPLYGAVHLHSFEDAIEYADARVRAEMLP